MHKMAKGSNGVLYLEVPAWGNALRILNEELCLRVVRVADTPIMKRRWSDGEWEGTSGVVIYFENEAGDEVGCWTEGMNVLQVFTRPRKVHEDMRSTRTLWAASEARIKSTQIHGVNV